jgi:hypothetical protein
MNKRCGSHALLRPDAVEESDILFRLQETRNALVLCAMLCCDPGCAFEVSAEAHLGRIRIALQQKRLFQPTAGAESTGEEKE